MGGTVARELAVLFIAARVKIAHAQAAAFLRQAVESRQATVETVRYVRSLVLESPGIE